MLFSQLIRIQLHKTALTSFDMKHERLTRLRSFFQIKHFNRIQLSNVFRFETVGNFESNYGKIFPVLDLFSRNDFLGKNHFMKQSV